MDILKTIRELLLLAKVIGIRRKFKFKNAADNIVRFYNGFFGKSTITKFSADCRIHRILAIKGLASLAFTVLLVGGAFIVPSCAQLGDRYSVINPYEDQKEFPYKASLHNHSQYHPEYLHSRHPTALRLKDYRDYDTEPKYGIVSITDHSRVTTPWNTVPSGIVKGSESPWGVDDILWLPGNENLIGTGSSQIGNISGHLLILNASTQQTDQIQWTKIEHPSTRSGWLYTSYEMPASVELTFKGIGFRWIACKEPEGGIVTVNLNGEKVGEVNLYAPEIILSQEVFMLDGLDNSEHSLQLVYDRKGDSKHRYMGTINMDMIEVIKADGGTVDYGAQHQEITYQPHKYKHWAHPHEEDRAIEELMKMLSEDGCFLVLAHPNSSLETSGEHKGTQLWTSSGYTYDELDILYGNDEKGIPPVSHPPHALEIGNRSYDFGSRTGFKNAEEKWDYLLEQGHRILGIASDDSHGATPFEGWIVVYTDASTRGELTIEDVAESLFSGNFYASQGPNIEIEVEKNKFTIQADKPSLIEFISRGEVVHRETNALTATYNIQGDEVYVRGRVTREDPAWRHIDGGGIGHRRSAWTNPLYVIN